MKSIVTIDLNEVADEAQLLAVIGECLCLGGPGGNSPVTSVNGGGWGLNWNALADSLTYLDSGGIWGTSPKYDFPLTLNFSGTRRLALACPQALGTLADVLVQAQAIYARNGMRFDFDISSQPHQPS